MFVSDAAAVVITPSIAQKAANEVRSKVVPGLVGRVATETADRQPHQVKITASTNKADVGKVAKGTAQMHAVFAEFTRDGKRVGTGNRYFYPAQNSGEVNAAGRVAKGEPVGWAQKQRDAFRFAQADLQKSMPIYERDAQKAKKALVVTDR